MGAIEPARQAGSTDTKLDQQLDHDGFAVGSLTERGAADVMFKRGTEIKVIINCTFVI